MFLDFLPLYILIFITGLCVGSFLNVVILRAFSGESIVLPPSKCTSCGNKLKWYHNIPLLSYAVLKGKCGFCGEKISIQYPIVEFITGCLFLALYFKFGWDLSTIFMWYFISIFIILAVCDIKEEVIFDFHSYFLVAGGVVFNFLNIGNFYIGSKIVSVFSHTFTVQNSFIASVLGIFAGILIMEIFARSGYLFAGTRAFGEGDTYIAAGLGAIFGWKYLLYVLIYSFIVQIIFTLPVFIKKLWKQKENKTLVGLGTFCFFLIASKATEMFFFNLYLYMICLISLAFTGLYLCREIILSIKRTDSANLTYLPFGPAMVIAATIFLFGI